MKKKIRFKIRKMKEKDIESVYKLGWSFKELEAYSGAGWYSKETLRSWLSNPDDVFLVAEIENKVVGFALSSLQEEKKTGYLEEMAVESSFSGVGIGSALLEKCIEELKRKGATYFYALTQTTNLNTLKFLEKRGFKRGLPFYWMERKKDD